MAKYKVEINRTDCISCGNCQAINPGVFSMSEEDGKVDLKGGADIDGKPGWIQVDLEDDNIEKNKQAESECPSSVIHVTELSEEKPKEENQ